MSLKGSYDLRGLPLKNLFSKLQPKTFTQEEAKALPVPHYLRGCFTKGLSSGHGPSGPSSHWLERLGAIFPEEGSEFMAPHVRERKEGGSNAFSLTAVGM